MVKFSELKNVVSEMFEEVLEFNKLQEYPTRFKDMINLDDMSKEIWLAYNVTELHNLVENYKCYANWMAEWEYLKSQRQPNDVLDRLFYKYEKNRASVMSYMRAKKNNN